MGDLALIPKTGVQSAAHVLLGDQLQTIISNFDEDWKAYNLDHWKAHYEQSQKDKAEYEKLRTADEGSLSKEAFFDLCWLTERYQSADDALETALRYRKIHPEDYRIAFFIGRLYLGKNDPKGIRFMEEALKEDELVESACELAYDFEIARDNQADALVWRKRAESHLEIVDKAQAERSMVSGSDTILAVSEPATLYEPIIAQFKDNPKIKHIWLAQKQVKHYQSIPVFVFAIDVKGFMTSEESLLDEIMKNLQTDVPVFGLTKSMDKKLYKKVCSEGLCIR